MHHWNPAGRAEGPLPWDTRLRICRGAALGLAYIHECSQRKHVHGDIKPNNILLDNNWDARISDFGLQRLLSLVGPAPGKEGELKKTDSQRGSSVSPAPILSPGEYPYPVSCIINDFGFVHCTWCIPSQYYLFCISSLHLHAFIHF